jgi:DNA repair protein RadC
MSRLINDQYARLVLRSVSGSMVGDEEAVNYILRCYPTPVHFKQMTRNEECQLTLNNLKMDQFLAAVKLGQLIARSHPAIVGHAYSSIELGAAMISHFTGVDNEQVCLACTDVHNDIIDLQTLFTGGRSECALYPDQIFKLALRDSASGVVMIHNHPSGDVHPSHQDLSFAKRLERGGKILGIQVLDFLIIGRDQYYSWREHQVRRKK